MCLGAAGGSTCTEVKGGGVRGMVSVGGVVCFSFWWKVDLW